MVAKKKCKSNQIINPSSGQCVKIDGQMGRKIINDIISKSPTLKKKTKKKAKSRSKSRSPTKGKILNPATGRMVSRTGKTGLEILAKKCKQNQVINPKTGYCVKKTGRIGQSIVDGSPKKKSKKKTMKKSPRTACKSGTIRNPVTKRCVKSGGRIGTKIRKSPKGKVYNSVLDKYVNL